MIASLLRSIDPKIIGHRVSEMRKTKGLKQQDVANLVGVARTTIIAVEKGQRPLKSTEIVRLCEHWGISVSDFVRQREVVDSFVPQLRADAKRKGIARDIKPAAEELRQFCENYLELENLCNSRLQRNESPPYETKGIPTNEAAEDIAIKERNRLGLGDGPILNLRELLETDVSLRIFYLKEMPSDVSGMFYYHEKMGGCIAVNIKHPQERGQWTLAHEYAHYLVNRFQPDVSPLHSHRKSYRDEQFADTFAGHFLMPRASLRRRYHELKQANDGTVEIKDICTLAHLYCVSLPALLIRLQEVPLIPAGAAAGVLERLRSSEFKVREAQEALGLPQRLPYDQPSPLRYQYLATVAFKQGDLSEGQFAQVLGVDRIEARGIAQALSHMPSISEDGRVGHRSIDLAETIVEGE